MQQNEKRLVHFAASFFDLFSSNLKLKIFTREYEARVKHVILTYRFVLCVSIGKNLKKEASHRSDALFSYVLANK